MDTTESKHMTRNKPDDPEFEVGIGVVGDGEIIVIVGAGDTVGLVGELVT